MRHRHDAQGVRVGIGWGQAWWGVGGCSMRRGSAHHAPSFLLKVCLPSGRALLRRFDAAASAADVFTWLDSVDELAVSPPRLCEVLSTTRIASYPLLTLDLPSSSGGQEVQWTLLPPVGSHVEGELLPTDETLLELGFAPQVLLRVRDEDA